MRNGNVTHYRRLSRQITWLLTTQIPCIEIGQSQSSAQSSRSTVIGPPMVRHQRTNIHVPYDGLNLIILLTILIALDRSPKMHNVNITPCWRSRSNAIRKNSLATCEEDITGQTSHKGIDQVKTLWRDVTVINCLLIQMGTSIHSLSSSTKLIFNSYALKHVSLQFLLLKRPYPSARTAPRFKAENFMRSERKCSFIV